MFGADMKCIEYTATTIGVISEPEEIRHVDNCQCDKELSSKANPARDNDALLGD